MTVSSIIGAICAVVLVLPTGASTAVAPQQNVAVFANTQCFYIDTPIYHAAQMCLQEDATRTEPTRWGLVNNTDWVLDLDSPGAWNDSIRPEIFPTRTDVTTYLTRLWLNDQQSSAVPIQPDETAYMPAYLSADGSVYPFPEGELRFNPSGTAAMVTVASAVVAADKVATDRSKLYKIIKRAKACATAGSAALLGVAQTDDAWSVVLAGLATLGPCKTYFDGVAKQAKVKVPASTWRVVAREFGDNFFIESRNAVIKLFQFAR